MNTKEFEIPVPWGYVAVKAWGNEKDPIVLCIHGLGDNAGSFDRLIPLLPASFYYVCIDLPSHGKSTPFPPHLLISALDNVLTLKIIVDYLNRKKYVILGHSWGGQTAVFFTQLYPQYIQKLIILDSFYFFPVGLNGFRDHIVDKFNALIRLNENIAKNKQPTYTYDEAVQKLISSRLWGELYPEAAKALVHRSIIPVENGRFCFSTDPRLKFHINPLFDMNFAVELIKKYPVTCPVLFVIASESEMQLPYFKEILKQLRKRTKVCKIERVTGCHDVHNNTPELVAPGVSEFLINVKNKL